MKVLSSKRNCNKKVEQKSGNRKQRDSQVAYFYFVNKIPLLCREEIQ